QNDTDISPNWKLHYEGHIATREELFREEVKSSLSYLKLRKIKKLIEQNQADLEIAKGSDAQFIFLQTHQHLKKMEQEITKEMGTVIFK
ncbi:MAG: DNA primase, partial [Ferruginibacter sp.]